MPREAIAYEAGGAMTGTLFLPENDGPVPGILVLPDIFGLGDHARERAARLAGLGYAALAHDLHGGERTLAAEQVPAELERLYADPAGACARAHAGGAALARHPAVDARRIAAIGFCYGGTLGLEMARRGAALRAVVGFHSGLMTGMPAPAGAIRGRILACIGSEDPSIPPEQRAAFEAEMRAAGADWQLHLYGGVYHTFTDPRCDAWGQPQFARYDARADARSWAAMRELLADAFADADEGGSWG